MSPAEMQKTIQALKFRDWKFEILGDTGVGWSLRVCFLSRDNWSPNRTVRHCGRKWSLSRYMTKSEIVQTALLAVLQALEHEAREQFMYKGRAIFGPHYDVDALLEIVDLVDVRKEN